MKSKYRKALVYDLETGGYYENMSSITEVAFVTVNMDNLEIENSESIVIKPYVDLNWISEPIDDAKKIYKNISEIDPDTKIAVIDFNGEKVTLKNLDSFVNRITEFYDHVKSSGSLFFTTERIKQYEQSEWKDIFEIFYSNAYTKDALSVTGITRETLESETSLSYSDAYKFSKNKVIDATVGSAKPILVGHNIGWLPRRIVKGKIVKPNGFDNPFMEKFFADNGDDWFYLVNDTIIDTLDWSRKKWTELPNYTLGTCANEVGLTLKEAHRALHDTIANAKFFIKMLSHLRGEGSLKKQYKRRKFKFQI